MPGSFQGAVLFVFAARGGVSGLEAFGGWLRRRAARRRAPPAAAAGCWRCSSRSASACTTSARVWRSASAFALGEAALGTLLIVGFTLHNTTEGLAIVAPLARDYRDGARPPIATLVWLGLIGGVPTIAGAWLGGFVYSPVWSVLFLALGVGAIAQVTVQILAPGGRRAADSPIPGDAARCWPGLTAGFAVMYVTGMLIG